MRLYVYRVNNSFINDLHNMMMMMGWFVLGASNVLLRLLGSCWCVGVVEEPEHR